MVEASYYGTPAVVLDTPIAREVVGEIGCYFKDAPSMIDQIMLLEEPVYYEERCAKARTLNWPNWSDYSPKVFNALRDVYEGRVLPTTIDRIKGMPLHKDDVK